MLRPEHPSKEQGAVRGTSACLLKLKMLWLSMSHDVSENLGGVLRDCIFERLYF